MGKLILIIGGARSGKSTFANKLVAGGKKVTFLATGAAGDSEMKERIKKHQKDRPSNWLLVEEEINIERALSKIRKTTKFVIIDCITLWVSNLLLAGGKEKSILSAVSKLVKAVKRNNFTVIMVTNEVGMGIVPENALSRTFRDIAGLTNQKLAKSADEVYLITCGISARIK